MGVKLKGKNRVGEFRRIAQNLASAISSFEGVTGIVLSGGLVRGFVDRFSDLDIIVLLDKKDERLMRRIRRIGSDGQGRFGIDVDLEIYSLDDLERKWGELQRWDFAHSKIIFDPNGKVRRLVEKKLKVRKSFWIKRIVIAAELLKWYCCPPEDSMGFIAEAWISRGDLASAHYSLNYAIELLLRMIFALNKEYLPPKKWRIFYSYRLKWLPKNYERLLREALKIKSLSVEDFYRRWKAIAKIWRRTAPQMMNETGLTLNKISAYYARRVLRQTPSFLTCP